MNYGQYQSFFPISSELKLLNDSESYLFDSRVTHSGSTSTYKNNEVFIKALRDYIVSHNYYSFYFTGVDAGASSARFGYYWGTKTLYFYDFPSVTNYYAIDKSGNFVPISISLLSSNYYTCFTDTINIFYYSVDESTDPGGSDDDPSKPGFFDGLLSSVKSLVNVICGFVGGVVQSLLSGITGIISTLIDAFKAVLSLGGHFGDFLAAALGFVPREIIDLLIAGIAVSIALAIIKFIRG